MLKKLLKKIIPKSFLLSYHRVLAIAANVVYFFPSHRLIVVGITGTKGKSSTALMITRILEQAGHKVGATNTIFFKIADKQWPNNTKQGMLGRFGLQRLLRQMVRAGCTHAVVEVTSEGISQSRHWGIAFDVVVFTNLSPEHIESHGSYEKYRAAKAQIFKALFKSFRKMDSRLLQPSPCPLPRRERDSLVKKIIVANRMDKEANYFMKFKADEKWGVWGLCQSARDIVGEKKLCAQEIEPTKVGSLSQQGEPDGSNGEPNFSSAHPPTQSGSFFIVEGCGINLCLSGGFMVSNAMLAIAAGRALGASLTTCKEALEKITVIPGRAEFINEAQNFKVLVDYAHEPLSLETILKTGRALAGEQKIIVVFGATGGGRDKSKRPIMGKLADLLADNIILTTDDPYDDDPNKLINDIAIGFSPERLSSENKNWWRIADRRSAIKQALSLAQANDVVLILGKGAEQVMAVAGGKLIPWNDSQTVRELLRF